jgi:hypothetical protein
MHSRKAAAKLPVLYRNSLLFSALIAARLVATAMRPALAAQGDTGLFDALRNVAGVSRQQVSGLDP